MGKGPHPRAVHVRGQARIGSLDVEGAALHARHARDPDAEVLPADLLPELRRQHALGVVVERFRQSADEQGLLVPATLLARDLRRLDEAPRREFGPLRRADGEGRQRSRRRDGAAKLLERELAVEQLRIGRRALEIGHAFRHAACGQRGPAGPVEALRLDLQRLAAARIAVEHRHRRHSGD